MTVEARRRGTLTRRLRRGGAGPIAISVLSVLVGFVAWDLIARTFPPNVFPGPVPTLTEAAEMAASGELWSHASASLLRILAGFAVASLAAVPIGVLVGSSRIIRNGFDPILDFVRFIPAIALTMFAVLWFGIGELSKVFLIAFTTFFIVVINTEAGVYAVPADRIKGARALGASPVQVLVRVTLPSIVPYLLTGMRIAMGRSFATIIAAEILAAQTGLGYLIWSSRIYSNMAGAFVGLFALGVLGFLMDWVFRLVVKAGGGRYAG